MESMRVYPFRSWVEVSRERIADNFRAVRAIVGPKAEVIPVVKADAYRHGSVEVSHVLIQQGARWLAVSNVEEGVILRQAGISARILVMADFLPAERPALIEYDLTPAIHSLADVMELDRLAQVTERHLHYHLKIDSGMGRLGTRAPAAEVAQTVAAAKHVTCEGLMTHFASSADYSNPQTEEQIACFQRTVDGLRACGLKPA